jgi:(p)ppGpp synthase/HD superfamily hydrolase
MMRSSDNQFLKIMIMRKTKLGKRVGKKDSERIEKAIHFLSDQYRRSGLNSKPVVLHSLEIAFMLLAAGASADAIIIAVLHDILEDSEVSFSDIEKEFGPRVAKGVLALTENKDIKKYEERYKENFARLLAEGGEAVVVKMADLLQNSHYISLAKDAKMQKQVINKIGYFLDMFGGEKYEEMHAHLRERHEEEKGRFADRNKKRRMR